MSNETGSKTTNGIHLHCASEAAWGFAYIAMRGVQEARAATISRRKVNLSCRPTNQVQWKRIEMLGVATKEVGFDLIM